MTKTAKLLRDSAAMRWTMLILIALTMFAAYVVSDEFSPLKTILEQNNHWNSLEYGWFSSAYSIFNVFLGMLIFGGLILDKMGIRFTGIMSCILMILGIGIKYWAVTTPGLLQDTMVFLGNTYKMQVVWAVVGFGIFGVGAEIAGITVTKAIAKWFEGHEIALAMGLQLSLARLGSAAALAVSPMIATKFGGVGASVLCGLALLVFGTAFFIIYSIYDRKLDKQLRKTGLDTSSAQGNDEEFHLSDAVAVIKNPAFWMIATLCVLFYSAVFPFLKYASDLMVNKFNVAPEVAGYIPSILPFGCIILTPLFGTIYDRKGHGADLMIFGAVLITCVHLLFAAPFVTSPWIAMVLMVLLGVGFAMLPSAMWPSLAKIMPQKQLGTTISLTFFIQNIGLWGVPLLIGYVLDKYCITGTVESIVNGQPMTRNVYDYTLPMLIFVSFCAISLVIAVGVKLLDRKKGYGLQKPNIVKD